MLLEITRSNEETVRLKHSVLKQLQAWERKNPKKAKWVVRRRDHVHTTM